MGNVTQQDDSDLLILSDDTGTTDTLVFDADSFNNEESPVSDELIIFDTNNANSEGETEDIKSNINTGLELESESLDITDNIDEKNDGLELGDLSLNSSDDITSVEISESNDLDGFNLSDTVEENNIEVELNLSEPELEPKTELESELSLDGLSGDTDIGETNIDTGETMVDILDGTIAKLSDRLDINKSETNTEEEHKSTLKEQITNLEAQVAVSEERISDLKSENTLISKNMKSIERMNSINNPDTLKKETSVKVHNVKRKAA